MVLKIFIGKYLIACMIDFKLTILKILAKFEQFSYVT